MPSAAASPPVRPSKPPVAPPVDDAAIAAHRIGRGGFAALVFSGAVEGLGESIGHGTWNTRHKFALLDPRVPAHLDFARSSGVALPPWPDDRIRPTPGVCFVLSDEGHPIIDTLRARGGVEHEHYVVLSRLTTASQRRRCVEAFLKEAESLPIALLGYGDQGERIAETLRECAVPHSRIHVVDDRPERRNAASEAGLCPLSQTDPILERCAVIATPLFRVPAFDRVLHEARRTRRPALDNSSAGGGRPELVPHGDLWLTECAELAIGTYGSAIAAAEDGLELTLGAIRASTLSIGSHKAPALRSGGCIAVSPRGMPAKTDALAADPSDPLSHLLVRAGRAFLTIDGQSNHHDAAFAIFATREFLSEFYSAAADAAIPSINRAAFGATPFERLVPRTTTGRSLGSPYMTACEQAALGILARHYCGAGAAAHPIIEIGSALGGSALLMAAATREAAPDAGPPILSIDPDAPTRGAMRTLFDYEGCAARLTQIVKTSDEAIPGLDHLRGKVGLVFIDGLHTAAASAQDFANYAPLVRQGGAVVFHDCDARHAGVFQTVASIARSDPRFSLRLLVDTVAVFERRMKGEGEERV